MKRIHRKLFFICLAVIPSLAACTHSPGVDAKIDAEVKQETPIPLGVPAAAASRNVILESKYLTPKERSELLDIHGKMASDVAFIRGDMAKLQVMLFRKMLDPNSKEAEITNIRTRLHELDGKRTNRIMSALDDVRVILDREVRTHEGLRRETDEIQKTLDPWKMM